MSNKAEAKAAQWILKGVLAEAPPEVREKAEEAAGKVRAIAAEYGDEGKFAVALVSAELVGE